MTDLPVQYDKNLLKKQGKLSLVYQNKYNDYPVNDKDGKTISGVIRSNIRIELRASANNLIVAETNAMIDGKEVWMQYYRFTRA